MLPSPFIKPTRLKRTREVFISTTPTREKLGREAGCVNVCGCPPAAALGSGVLLVLASVRSLGPCSGKTFAEVLGLSSFVVLLSVVDSDPLGFALFDGFIKKYEI